MIDDSSWLHLNDSIITTWSDLSINGQTFPVGFYTADEANATGGVSTITGNPGSYLNVGGVPIITNKAAVINGATVTMSGDENGGRLRESPPVIRSRRRSR